MNGSSRRGVFVLGVRGVRLASLRYSAVGGSYVAQDPSRGHPVEEFVSWGQG